MRVIIAFFQRSPEPTDEPTLADEIRTTAISWDVSPWIYLNEVLWARWRRRPIQPLCQPLIAVELDRPRGLMDLVVIEA